MSRAGNSGLPLEVTPAYLPPWRPSFMGWIARFIGILVIAASFLLNIVLLVILIFIAGKRAEEPNVREVLETQAAVLVGNTPEEFRIFIREESAKYAKIVQVTGVKVK